MLATLEERVHCHAHLERKEMWEGEDQVALTVEGRDASPLDQAVERLDGLRDCRHQSQFNGPLQHARILTLHVRVDVQVQ